MKNKKRNQGITLIALVVTIVVLLILAGISISMLTGENGIILKAQESKIQNAHGEVKDTLRLAYNEYQLEKQIGANNYNKTFLEFLKEKDYIDDNGIVQTQELLGKKSFLGNGTGIQDVYKIEEEDEKYKLNYYDKAENKIEIEQYNIKISNINNPNLEESPTAEYFTYSEPSADNTVKITGLKEEYMPDIDIDFGGYGSYSGKMPLYIKIDENNKITDIEFPSVVEINGVKCTVTSIGPVFSLADHSLLGWRYIWQGVLSEITSVVLPSTITSIEDYAFSYCDSLLDVTIPDTVTSIGEHAFLGCENLEEIVIPDAVTSIGDMAFSGCDNLSDITFSDNINMIGDYAFQGTAWLENQPDGELYIGNVYYGYIGQMQDNTSITIREGTKAIASEAFYECEGLTNITVPNSVTYIGYRAFSGTTWLENQPEGDLYIGSVYYRYIGQMPANNNVEIKNGTTAIAYGAFNSDDEMISITMPDSVEYIGDGAFAGCKKLTNVNLSKNLKKINSGLFSSCDNLTSITIPNRVKSIETQAFLYCPNLTNITISENLERIGQNAFNGTKIKSITLPQSIRSIGYYSFGGCTELENITILSDERCIISTNSFSGCNNVTTINIKAEENSIYGAPWGASSSATINWNYTGN